ncbi:hypothetical protein ACFFKE_10435 [Streptomyces mutabilis]|uniref:hypothetical protein n=1 Tax=Streptomyces mutabilis TaxID=67332 RepID=UPI001780DC0C|nr:hypothetical protein [Streptomyces mutabilis]
MPAGTRKPTRAAWRAMSSRIATKGLSFEQEAVRVDRVLGPEEIVAAGRDAECLALAHAAQWHVGHRVLLNGNPTVVLR